MSAQVEERPITLAIAALGGQGGGVLAGWLIEVAEADGYLVQSTSVPGVAQRTGATIYYLEFFPREAAQRAGREPVMALMPVPGDVDCVVASELLEAGRAIQRGLVTPERTTLIASSHRDYTIAERSALGRGMANSGELAKLAQAQAKRLILFDMAELAARHESVISSVLLGAIAGSGVLPFAKESYEAAIRHGGIAVDTNLAAFADAFRRAAEGGGDPEPASHARLATGIPERASSPRLQPLLERIRRLPAVLQPLALAGVRRLLDYQDAAYAQLYLTRLERVLALDERQGPGSLALTEVVARHLALWMSFEDTIRVADLKTRAERFEHVRREVRGAPDQVVGITEFMRPRVHELAGTLPAAWGRRVLSSPGLCRLLGRWTRGRRVRTSTLGGFLLLYGVAVLRRWRRGTLRYQAENARIQQWLGHLESLADDHYALAVELARAQRLVRGYGDTYERGWRNFTALIGTLNTLMERSDGALWLARLQEAALADEAGEALARELAGLGAQSVPPQSREAARA